MSVPVKTPEKIKKGLECCIGDNHEFRCDQCPYNTGEELVGCVDEGLTLYEDACTFIQQLEAQVPRWISVEERLPDKGEKVIVCGVRGGIQAGIYKGHSTVSKQVWWWKHNTYLKVAWWMPESMLPEPPKEDAHE